MDDFEKNRAEHVLMLEQQLQHLQRQLAELKPLADKWTPQIGSEMTPNGAYFTLAFGGKRVTATVTNAYLESGDTTTLTSSIIDTLCQSLVVDRLREVVQPEVEKIVFNRGITQGAAKW
jgi:hypothetical protein